MTEQHRSFKCYFNIKLNLNSRPLNCPSRKRAFGVFHHLQIKGSVLGLIKFKRCAKLPKFSCIQIIIAICLRVCDCLLGNFTFAEYITFSNAVVVACIFSILNIFQNGIECGYCKCVIFSIWRQVYMSSVNGSFTIQYIYTCGPSPCIFWYEWLRFLVHITAKARPL